MHIATGGVAEQAFGGMVGRLRRGAGLSLDIRQKRVAPCPTPRLGFRHDRPQRHVEADAAPEGRGAPAEILRPIPRLAIRRVM